MTMLILFFLLLLTSSAESAVLFEDSFESDSDWTVEQPLPPETQCYPSTDCGMPGGWTAYKNGSCRCGSGISGRPGNNLWYINTGSGYGTAYSSTPTSCYSGTKCATMWVESCVDGFEDSDGSLAVDLGQEYSDLYVRWYIKFKPSYELMNTDWQIKLFHVQHSVYGSNPFTYFSGSGDNVPLTVGGLSSYSDNHLYFWFEARCYGSTYAPYAAFNYDLGTISAQRSSGLLDGAWHCIEIRQVRNSSIGVADGSIQLWIDGTEKIKISGSPYANQIAFNYSGASELRGFRTVLIGGNNDNQWDLSSSTMESREQWYAVDDVVVSTTYVGTDYEIGGESPTPATITGLTVVGVSIQ